MINTSETVLIFNVMAGNIPHVSHLEDVQLPCAIQTEPVVTKPLGVFVGKSNFISRQRL